MNQRLQRFDLHHLRDFRSPIAVNTASLSEHAKEEVSAPPPPPVFNEEDVEHARDAAKKLGYAEGFEAGLAQAHSEQTALSRDLAHTLGRIGDQLTLLTSSYQQLIDQQSAELSELVLMIARKVAGEALHANAADTVQALVARCLPVVFSKPKVTLELSPLMMSRAEIALREHIEQAGFEGDIQFRVVDGFDESDIRIEWANGEASRNVASLWQEIEALLHGASLTPTLPVHEQEPLGDTHG
jgi:flagellar assembly protein FliH